MLSIIVCTRNRRDALLAALTSLGMMDTPGDGAEHRGGSVGCEIIVVDNGSTDGTAVAMVGYHTAGPFPVRYVREEKLGHSAARNRGIREARGSWILFVDDDATVDPGWARKLVAGLEAMGVEVGGGRVDPIWPARLPRWVATTGDLLERIIFIAYSPTGGPRRLTRDDPVPVGCSMAFRREVFAAQGFFSEKLGHQAQRLLGGEDAEFLGRLRANGYAVGYVPDAVVRHPVAPERLRIRYLLRRRYWEGFGMASFGEYRDRRQWLGVPLILPLALLMDLRRCAAACLRLEWPAAAHALGGMAHRLGALRGHRLS